MRSWDEVAEVQALAARGLGASEVARRTGIPRGTVRHWLTGELPGAVRPGACPECGTLHDAPPAESYAYALGMYLGDGCIMRHPRGVWRLEIALDSIYPGIIAECAAALRDLRPNNRVARVENHGKGRYVIVRSYSKAWPCLFPQHGPGRKHERKIVLEPWQERIVDAHPQQFVRGLIHSDGCRVANHVNGKDYPRYFFSQVSDDIRGLFCRSLDAFVGPKR